MGSWRTGRLAFAVLSIFVAGFAVAAGSEPVHQAEAFFAWLKKNETAFEKCGVQKDSGVYVLCDGTRVSPERLRKLFAQSPADLLGGIRAEGIRVEILCDDSGGGGTAAPFAATCQKTSEREIFSKITSLHGMYLPPEKTILIRSSATPGSLIHEYLHHLQSENSNRIFGHVYKKERNGIQKGLTEVMNREIAAVQDIETSAKSEQKGVIQPHVQAFMKASGLMKDFGPWQDLIDERSLFLLYLKYGKEFGASDADLAIARKNLGFICASQAWAGRLPAAQCP